MHDTSTQRDDKSVYYSVVGIVLVAILTIGGLVGVDIYRGDGIAKGWTSIGGKK
jgi:hypothetical protein